MIAASLPELGERLHRSGLLVGVPPVAGALVLDRGRVGIPAEYP